MDSMRSIAKIAFVVVVLTLTLLPAAASGMSLTRQWPTPETWEHRTAWPVSLTFEFSLNTSTVTPSSFWITPAGSPAEIIDGDISFQTVNLPNDTAVFSLPLGDVWTLGAYYQIHAAAGIQSAGGDAFDGVFPGGGLFVANVPMDFERPDYDPSDPFGVFVNASVLAGFDIIDPESTDPSKPWTIPGMGATEAWKYTTGRPEVVIAVIDNGMSDYHDPELAGRYFLNKGELQMPKDGAANCPDWDCNGDGRFSASDYLNDPRVPAPPAGEPLSPAELIEAFADNVDGDQNGFVDDISGWDFWRNRPDAIGIEEWQEGAHGGARARDACAMADNHHKDKPGFCPNCTILPVRVSDAVMAAHNSVTWGVEYASMMGAQIGVAASGTPDYSYQDDLTIQNAYDNGMILVAAAGDELGFHHSFPAAGEDVFSVKSIFPMPNIDLFGILPIEMLAFTETYCTNYNEHVHAAASSGACSSEATSNTGGAMGLLLSRAMDLGIDLTPGEIKQLVTMTSDDIKNHCMTLTGGGCQPGFDRHFGYGRPNLRSAMIAMGDGVAHRIPPDVSIVSPRWWTVFDPTISSTVEIEAYIYARGDAFNYEVQAARGHQPLDGDFATIDSGSGQLPVSGTVATLDLYDLFADAEMRGPTLNPDQYTFTVRVRAWRASPVDVMGEDRKAFAAYTDDDPVTGYLPGLPFDVEASGESSPVLYDLDGRDGGKLELIYGTTDGNVEVFGFDDERGIWARRPGFPVNIRGSGLNSHDLVIASPAVGDLFGDGVPIIVVNSGNARIFAVWPDGNLHLGENGDPAPILPGFPYQAPKPDPSTPLSYGHGSTFAAAPVLADLDKDGMLEIIGANYDSKIYAFKPVDNDGDGVIDFLPGFPATALSIPGLVPDKLVCRDEEGNLIQGVQILGTPAVGILDPDSEDPEVSQYPSIVVPTTEVCFGGLAYKTGRLYAIRHDGTATHTSAFHDGWPKTPPAPLSDLLPIPPLTNGITAAPAIARDGHRTLIGTGAFAFPPQIIKLENGEVTTSTMNSILSVNISGHGAFGPLEPGGPLHYALPTLSAVNIVEGWISILRPMLMAWDLTGLAEISPPPVTSMNMEDINFYMSPVIADVDGDGRAEVIAGSSGFLLHALSKDGTEPVGWPKFTFNWLIASAVAGDANHDGKLEIFVPTHEGHLFGWKTTGPACNSENESAAPWRRFHHDERNTGYYGTDTLPPGVITDFRKSEELLGGTKLTWTATGDDWYCGRAARYEIRAGTDADVLRTPEGFDAAQVIEDSMIPRSVGWIETYTTDQPSSLTYAIRAVDEAGNKSHIAIATFAQGDDDTDDDTDDDMADDAGDDDDGGCGC